MSISITLLLMFQEAGKEIKTTIQDKCRIVRKSYHVALGMVLAVLSGQLHAAPLDLADTPVSVITSVKPNVMILMDNSGSMNIMAWSGSYDTRETYQNWCGNCNNRNLWPASGTIDLNRINNSNADGSCSISNPISSVTIIDPDDPFKKRTIVVPRYVVQGNYAGTTKCLILADPLGNGYTNYDGHYLNYLFQTYSDGTDLTQLGGSPVTVKTRLQLARDLMVNLVDSTASMNFGLSTFNGTHGAIINQSCDPDASLTSSKISNITANSWTPLGEALYEITRYFRGLPSAYTNTKYETPITHRCQKNYVIVVTDGYATRDTELDYNNSNDPDVEVGCNSNDSSSLTPPCLPDWDELHPPTAKADYPNFPAFSDGFTVNNEGRETDEGYTLYLDDIAKFAYDIDLLSDPPKDGSSASAEDLNLISYDEPPFEKQNIETYTIGFSIANQMLEDAAHYGSGKESGDPRETDPKLQQYFTATTGLQLQQQLQQAITNIESKNTAAAAVSASSGFVGSSSGVGAAYIYQGTFDTTSWTGDVSAYEIDQNNGDLIGPILKASDVLKDKVLDGGYISRKIFTYSADKNTGIPFDWTSLDATQRAYLDNRQEILEYIRGSTACELSSTQNCNGTKDLRDRDNNFMGTVVGSSPLHIGIPPFFYPHAGAWPSASDPENAPGAQSYADFKKLYNARRAMLYVGGNDGMLHAYDAGFSGNEFLKRSSEPPTLEEKFAFIPNAVMPYLKDYSSADFQHRFYVDGTPTVIDAFYDSKWHSVLVGGLNKGGQGIYAIDVTKDFSKDNFEASDVLWEFSDSYDDSSSPDIEGADLGFTFSRPAIVRMHNGRWAAIFGNGYNNTHVDSSISSTGYAALYIVDLETGKLIRKISTDTGSLSTPNGLATPIAIDLNSDYIIDFIYAGDLQGNLWRFDVTSNDPNSWTVLGRGTNPESQPLFKAVDISGKPQPITSRPAAARAGHKGIMLYFGTGMYLQPGDKSDTSPQTFYALLDNPLSDHNNASQGGGTIPQVIRGTMAASTIVESTYSSSKGNVDIRNYTSGSSNLNAFTSWYVDLPGPGERVVSTPLVRGTKRPNVVYSSIIPTNDACDFGGSSWLTELNGRNGGDPTHSVFDLNGDGDPANDKLTGAIRYQGLQPSPTIVGTEGGVEYKYMSNTATAGNMTKIIEREAPDRKGRVSWRQIK